MKKGVKAITGKREIMVGVWENFKVSAWYAETPMNERNEAFVKWALYYVEKGKAPRRVLEKEIGHFRFKQEAVGKHFIIVAYSHEPELDNESAIHITIVSNEKPEILGLKLTDIKSNPITTPMSYGQMVNIHANTVGMIGHKVFIALWEDQDGFPILVQEKGMFVKDKGIVHAQFVLPRNAQKIWNAQIGKTDSKASFHISVYSMGAITMEAVIKMKAEGKEPVLPGERKKEVEDKINGEQQPKADNPPYKGKVKKEKINETPKDNIPTHSPKTFTTVVKGGVKNVFFIDENWKAITQQKNNRLRIYIVSEGIVGKQVKLQLWEDDKSFLSNDANDLLETKVFEITADKCYHDITLTKAMQDKGAELGEGWSQELFVQIHVLDFQPNIKLPNFMLI